MRKKLLAALLALCMVVTLLPAAALAADFTDVPEDHWAASSIDRWAGYGVLNGHGDGTFTPDEQMTRAEFAAMLVKMLGLTAKSDAAFDDVDGHWAAEVISIAVKAGIINGVGDNKFDPDAPVTFEQAAVMMCRAFGLAKNTGGDDWAKESIDKLTGLGMIGEGADEHLQVGVDCDRAVVAALADAVVAEYVNEDRAEPITGEIKGVVLVVNNAKAEIKDASVMAPIVVESASVTLTNTQAEDVKVSGAKAELTTDADSTVTNVTLGGEAPKADIKGDVASVTIDETATSAVVDAPKAADDAIVNNSTSDATVNGETVEGKPEEPAPVDPVNPATPGDTTGGDDAGVTINPPESLEIPEGSGAADTEPGDPVIAVGSGDGAGDADAVAACEHAWGDATVTKEASCSELGTQTQTCSKCKAVKTTELARKAHTANEPEVAVAGDCVTQSVMKVVCAECGKEMRRYAGPADPTKHTNKATLAAKEPTCTASGLTAGEKCTDCGKTLTAQTVLPATGHTFKDGETVLPACSVCGVKNPNFKLEDPEECSDAANHANIHLGQKCAYCGTAGVKAHSWTDVADSDTATCTAPGKKDQTCDCGATQKVDTPKKAHDYTNHVCGTCGAVEEGYCEHGKLLTESCTECNRTVTPEEPVGP